MFEVSVKNGDRTTYIHRGEAKLGKGRIVKGINTIDSFSFTIFPNNEGYQLINDFTSLVDVYNTKTRKYEFRGRVLKSKDSMDESGLIYKEVVCESLFGFLCDSVQEYHEVKNWTVSGLLNELISTHNSQVEEYKQMTLGEVTATDDNDNLYLGIARENTWDAIQNNLIKKIGGELQFRVENGVTYVDYLSKIGSTKATTIELRKNMKSISRDRDASAFITRLIPLGAKLTDEAGKETEERVTIETVNDGLKYIDDTQGIASYGLHLGYQFWDDVNSPQILKTKAINWLSENNHISQQITVDAVELALLGLDIDYIDMFNSYPVIHDLIGIDETLRVIKKDIDILNPSTSSVDFGDTFKTLSQLQLERDKQIAEAVEGVKKIGFINANYVTNEQLSEIENNYWHIRYSANADGKNMTVKPADDTAYMGIANTGSSTAPTSASDYTWSRIKGEAGSQGERGEKGADGDASYLHIKYSDDGGETFTENDGEDIGRYRGELVDTNPTDSLTPSDYTWLDLQIVMNEELEEIRQEVLTSTTEIQQTTEEVILSAVSELVSTGDFDTFKSEVSTQLGILSDELLVKFTSAMTEIETVENETQSSFETLESYIRGYMNETGQPVLELGSAQSLILLKLENDRIAFLQSGIEVAYISNNSLYITDGKFLNSLQIGNFAFIPRANGSLDFKKVT